MPNPRVLYVDDDADSREMLRALLRSVRMDVTAVGTATRALSLAQASGFELYLLDAWLPDFSGFELCRRVRTFDTYTPILFYSGAAFPEDKNRGMEAGACGYVVKPDIDGLVRSIKQFALPFVPPIATNTLNTNSAGEQSTLRRQRVDEMTLAFTYMGGVTGVF